MAELAPETPPETPPEVPPETPPETPPEVPPETPPETPPDPADWRATLKSDDAKKYAEGSPDVDHLVNRGVQMRKQLEKAIIPLAEDAKPEEVAAYRKRTGVPEAAEGYEITRPEHLDEDTFKSEPVQQRLNLLRERMHAVNAPASIVKVAVDTYWDIEGAAMKAQVDEDKKYAEEGDAELHRDWPGKEYDANREHAERAAVQMFGDNLEEFRHLVTKDGKFIGDHPIMLRALAGVGREMEEAGRVPPLSEADRAATDDQIRDIRTKIADARGRGDDKEANRLYQTEQVLIAKTKGNATIVGAEGRAA